MTDWKIIATKMKKNHRSIVDIARKTGKTPEEIKDYLGVKSINTKDSKLVAEKKVRHEITQNNEPEIMVKKWDGVRVFQFGLIGDTHMNSKYSQITYLREFYDLCKDLGVEDVYHTGDIDEGEDMRIGHKYECYTQGADEHIAEIVKNYPRVPGITTHFITGNHDASIYKKCGVDIGRSIAERRPDMHYLGRDCARVELAPHCILELRHPWDGTAYALSYKPQKMLDGLEADTKPNIMAIGHYHKLEYVFYRNIHCFQTGTFQMQTPFTRGKGISVHMGGWIVTVAVDEEGHVKSISPTLIPFYKGNPDDYKIYQ